MKKHRPILPVTLLLISLSAVLLFLLSKEAPFNSAQTETTNTTSPIETTVTYAAGGNIVTESGGSADNITVDDIADKDITNENSTNKDITGEKATGENSPLKNPTAQDYSAQETTKPFPILTKEEFFADALFIGDSRTVGLRDYAELETATFFAYSGLSSFSAFKKMLDVEGIGETDLERLLTNRSFGKIYLMLGINELGYPFSSIVSRYTQVAMRIHELQPQATILLCANLRVVADGKEVRDYIANDTINQLNAEIAALADGETFFYIDANPLFDDGNGALDPQYCSDDLHPYGKYYYQWAEWLYEIGIPKA